MSRYVYQGTMRDGHGHVILGGTVSVYLAGTTTAADVYEAYTGGTAVNSVTSSSTDGTFAFYVDLDAYDAGQLFKVVLSKAGYSTSTYDNIAITYEPASSDFTSKVSAASDSAAGKVELATASETTTGTDTGRAVTPDGLAGSNFGKRVVEWFIIDPLTSLATGDGKAYFVVPDELNGMNLVRVSATVVTAGTTNSTTIQIANVTDSVDMLSTAMSIETTETSTRTSASPGVIDTTHDDVATGDVLRCDIDAVSTTAPKGLIVEMVFQLP